MDQLQFTIHQKIGRAACAYEQRRTSSVQSWNEKDEAATAAWNAPGVKSVRNDIAVVCA